jgi:hypothetical protein
MFILSNLLGFLSPIFDSLNKSFLLKIFCTTKIKQDPSAQASPMKLLENVNEQARITPVVKGTSAVYTCDEYLTWNINR